MLPWQPGGQGFESHLIMNFWTSRFSRTWSAKFAKWLAKLSTSHQNGSDFEEQLSHGVGKIPAMTSSHNLCDVEEADLMRQYWELWGTTNMKHIQ